MTFAFKEWAVVVDALGRGEQIFILRKGGIHEGKGGFRLEHDNFALFPTQFHQQREAVIPAARERFDLIAPQFTPGLVRIDYVARVEKYLQLESFEDVQRLQGMHVWKEEVLAERFEWGKSQSIHLIIVRVSQVETAVEMPMLESYGGCKSWIQLAHDIPEREAFPVLSDQEFAAKQLQVERVLAAQ